MPIISLIAAVDRNNGLGKNNTLLCYLPADLKRFKSLTLGKPIIMGRKTFESIGKPLPGRLNIVLTKQDIRIEGVEIAHDLKEALNRSQNTHEIFIIGGSEVFRQSMKYAERIYLTRIHHQFNADVFFPTLDESIWQKKESFFFEHDRNNPYDMTFYQYEKPRLSK